MVGAVEPNAIVPPFDDDTLNGVVFKSNEFALTVKLPLDSSNTNLSFRLKSPSLLTKKPVVEPP